MILLDTNVISELMKPNPNRDVEAWAARQSVSSMFISSVTEAELRFGAAVLPKGRKRKDIIAAIDAMILTDFAGRVLPFDSSAAVVYAVLASDRRSSGRPISQFDAQIAAITRSRGAALATRNISDFEGCGIVLIDPWNTDAAS